jgi:sulfur carrier protein ThiS
MSLPVLIPLGPALPVPQATIVWPRNPFHPADKDLYLVEPGSTVADWMRSQSITEFPLPTVCLVNGQPLLRKAWPLRPLAAHDVVVFVSLPGGGGGGGGSNVPVRQTRLARLVEPLHQLHVLQEIPVLRGQSVGHVPIDLVALTGRD